jgi:hypothetical protein
MTLFGWFSKKTEVQQLIDRLGMEGAVEHCAGIVSRRIPTAGVFRQFILEELDAAQNGNAAAKEFVRSSGVPASEYMGAMGRSRPAVDGPNGPQQELVRICLQLGDDTEQVARFRIAVVQSLMRNVTTEDPNAPQRKAPEIRTEADVMRLISEQGVEVAGHTLRRLAHEGNLTCQLALSGMGLELINEHKKKSEQPNEQVWQDCETFTKLAAEQGDTGSQFALAKLYVDAIDLSGDYLLERDLERLKKAVVLHRKAAAQGYKDSVQELKWLEDTFPDVVRSA